MRHAQAFIERMGVAAESDGLTRIAGRLFGALLLSRESRSLDDLAEELGVSKASVSTDARKLADRGVIARVARPGDRRDYYELAPDFFNRLIAHRVERWRSFQQTAAELQRTSGPQPKKIRERFAYIQDVHDFVLERVEAALDEWASQHR